ncbi:class I adenylate-forming enzyme family protein [Mesorhizobium sp. B4-1-4]|uniref:class I adenylate-forming enzyme family protein n=1 Tax=Mesorhizobium sp. B4-1-4 TaxID=2589888 RepID=UPI001D00DB98|nr:class I adenylate-forming enzyme family protein [Mesorhizobium sp. B4-1-4]UCI34909.1 acyl--CoA ligase [Mesorhizobium sp. B4-1-4]
MIGRQAAVRPDHVALVHGERQLTCSELDALIDRVAAGLQRNAVKPQDVVAVCASSSAEYVAVFMGALRAGVAVAPLAPSSTPASLATMIADSGACLLFLDHMVAQSLVRVPDRIAARHIALDGSAAGEAFEAWLPPAGTRPDPVEIQPDWPFNIIYSSGTTGAPKGIVHSHAIRWQHIRRGIGLGYGPNAVTLISIPLYSNTTLVSLIPALAGGGTVVLMDKFEVVRFLEQAQSHRATHTMLVPVQYRRLMEHPDFDRYDLSSFQMKFSTSAPFSAAVKAEVLKRWPGGLMEFYGMTEGGAGFVLAAHEHPDKLHTVGRPVPDADIRLIDEEGREVPVGAIGEVVGHSPSMMNGYHNQPGKTAEVEWRDATGKRFIRTGDVGRLDEDGFLILMDRRKDMIISGGFNIYPSDLEAVLTSHEAVAEAAVVGVPSNRWGETPIALVVLNAGTVIDAEDLRIWANERVGKMQRLHALQILSALPRSAIGKVLKRELRDQYAHLASE